MKMISNKEDLSNAIARIQHYKSLMEKYKGLMDKYREQVVRYLEINNRKSITADDGSVWQKRQNTSISYQLDELRVLLRKHRVNPATVIVTRTVEEVDEDALIKLLKSEVISVEEFEEVAVRHTGRPFIVRVPNAKRKSKAPISIGSRRLDQRKHRHDGPSRREEFRQAGRGR